MKIIKFYNNLEDVLSAAVEKLKMGGSVVYPTDTVYGMGVNPFDDFAVRRLFRVKKRPSEKPMPLIVRSIAMAKKLAYVDEYKEKILKAVWPGAVSVVLKKRDVVPSWISAGTDTVSLRIPDNDFCISLIKVFDSPITSTSANMSGEPSFIDPEKIFARFVKETFRPDLIIDAGVLKSDQLSTILDLSGEKPRILRVGPVTPQKLASILGIK